MDKYLWMKKLYLASCIELAAMDIVYDRKDDEEFTQEDLHMLFQTGAVNMEWASRWFKYYFEKHWENKYG